MNGTAGDHAGNRSLMTRVFIVSKVNQIPGWTWP